MASTTETRSTDNWRKTGGEGAAHKDTVALMPTPHPPPSPPATETEIDESESESVPFPDIPQSSHDEVLAASDLLVSNNHGGDATKDATAAGADDGDEERLHTSEPATETSTSTESSARPLRAAPSDPDFGTESETSIQQQTSHTPTQSPITSPPYWNWTPRTSHERHSPGSHGGHVRTVSSTSVDSTGLGIILRDNENDSVDIDGRSNACWAKSVQVTDYVVVNGSATNIGAFVVFNIRVETLTGSFMNIRKRYSEFDDFRWRLMRTFPGFEAAVPELPPKSLISKFRPRFLERRRAGLQYFLNCILLNPEFSGSPVLKEFLFS